MPRSPLAVARVLAEQLEVEGIESHVEGRGLHCLVTVAPVGDRSLVIHCLWYDVQQRSEYSVHLRSAEREVVYGRTRSASDVIRATSEWLAGESLDRVVTAAPFIDAKPRALRAIMQELNGSLRWGIDDETLWLYGNGRSVKITLDDAMIRCVFMLGQAPIARGESLPELPDAVTKWLADHVAVNDITTQCAGMRLEPHAETIERDPLAWHWTHLRDRIDDPHDSLAGLRPLLLALAVSPIATRFFSFSSHNRFCFSASSDYPWVNAGLPVIAPLEDGFYLVDGKRLDQSGALASVEATLVSYPIKPFFGSEPQRQLPLLTELLRRAGSGERPRLIQEGAWYRLVTGNDANKCVLRGLDVTFMRGDEHRVEGFRTLEEAAAAIHHFLDVSARE
jgi:hypothetical protein